MTRPIAPRVDLHDALASIAAVVALPDAPDQLGSIAVAGGPERGR